MKSLIHLLLFFLPFFISAQVDTAGQHRLIKGLINYRHELIARNVDGFMKLYRLDTLWQVKDKEAIGDLLSGVTYANKYYGASAEQIVLVARSFGMDTFEYSYLLTVDILRAIIENDDMALLIGEQILKPKPPFMIEPDNSFFSELAFYKIEDGMKIGEIGAGTGLFGLLLGLAYDSLSVYLNDVKNKSMEFAFDRIERCQSIRSGNRYLVTEGKRKTTKLEEYQLDKIIIRNAFHHFSHQQKMLASIQKSMTPTSELLLFEPEKRSDSGKICPRAMKMEDMREVLEENGFNIVEEKHLEKWGWVLIRCKLAISN